jgi:hypothetical protein
LNRSGAITLTDLRDRFALVPELDDRFFREWQDALPELESEAELALDEVKRDYLHLSRYDLLEPIVKMVVLSPILRLAGFYRDPFYVAAEKKVELLSEDRSIETGICIKWCDRYASWPNGSPPNPI